MNDNIDTSDGTWREVSPDEWANDTAHDSLRTVTTGGGLKHWVRIDPVPPLPTVPYTVIALHVADGLIRRVETWMKTEEDGVSSHGDTVQSERALRLRITGFEVLSEPPAVTAKAVLGRLVSRLEAEGIKVTNIAEWIDMTGREFGVDR